MPTFQFGLLGPSASGTGGGSWPLIAAQGGPSPRPPLTNIRPALVARPAPFQPLQNPPSQFGRVEPGRDYLDWLYTRHGTPPAIKDMAPPFDPTTSLPNPGTPGTVAPGTTGTTGTTGTIGEQDMSRFAPGGVASPSNIEAARVAELRRQGLSDEQIVQRFAAAGVPFSGFGIGGY
jgi:hypothetical protein